MTEQRTDYDSPWKEIIELYFPDFLEFFFPLAYAEIDWTRPHEFLDTELQQLEPDAEIGKRLVDKVVKVWLLDGEEAWVLVHVEVQGHYDSQFPKRMYTYNYRLFDRHQKRVISLAVLADEEPNWRPSSYKYQLGGCSVSLEFPIAKLLDYEAQWETLEETTNPFGVVVIAHLKTKATRRNPESRLQWKLSLVRRLFERGYSRQDILGLFRFIDWIMVLPDDLARSFKVEVRSYEEKQRMRYVTSIERLAKEEERLHQAKEYVIKSLRTRFGEAPESVVEAINSIEDPSLLEILFTNAITVSSIQEFQQLLTHTISKE
ncbi:transposase [Aetokthonos hydrillicola Thurmond2011]|uniref:Transposase n=1 Tax=Aetokthonos hydrillicola Thurmond2011 TaxID=2712845 RepID=A0AAP5I6K7_9CYAN|nr:transposase [Aetokthonos hydrillicola]MBW4586861.1 transposase [Aetokthonos hydrillicola CCALA 1050]MDR9895781.1 transposase [Aetokthonos hydrillicola Thurmond2011]